jgi:hypothetical protein
MALKAHNATTALVLLLSLLLSPYFQAALILVNSPVAIYRRTFLKYSTKSKMQPSQ